MCLSSSFSSIGNLSSLVKGLLRLVVRVKIPGGGAPFDSMYSCSSSLLRAHTDEHTQIHSHTFRNQGRCWCIKKQTQHFLKATDKNSLTTQMHQSHILLVVVKFDQIDKD